MEDTYEKEARELILKMNQQFKMFNPQKEEITNIQNNEQGLMKEATVIPTDIIKRIKPDVLKPSSPPTPVPTPGACSQCGMLHPPLKPGEICPNAKVEVKSEKNGKEVNINKYVTNIRDVIISQISIKKIKDPDKLFQNITLELTKFLEGYNE